MMVALKDDLSFEKTVLRSFVTFERYSVPKMEFIGYKHYKNRKRVTSSTKSRRFQRDGGSKALPFVLP